MNDEYYSPICDLFHINTALHVDQGFFLHYESWIASIEFVNFVYFRRM